MVISTMAFEASALDVKVKGKTVLGRFSDESLGFRICFSQSSIYCEEENLHFRVPLILPSHLSLGGSPDHWQTFLRCCFGKFLERHGLQVFPKLSGGGKGKSTNRKDEAPIKKLTSQNLHKHAKVRHPRPNPSTETPLTTRIRILWAAKLSPIHQKMSSITVLREICTYIGDGQKLIAVLKNEVKWLDVANNQWQQLIALRQNIQVDWSTSSTFITLNRILACGGGGSEKTACTRHIGCSAYMLEGDGSVRKLPPMSTKRNCHGVALDSVRQALYVFGGWDGKRTCYTERLRTSEMFLSEWSPLPDMHQARSGFNPCWHSSIVYLCWGSINSVETYDPRSSTFVLQDLTLPESRDTIAVVDYGTLTVISENYISKLQQGKLTSQKLEVNSYPWSSCTPLVSGGAVYVYWNGTCRCINLTTGAVQQEVRLS